VVRVLAGLVLAHEGQTVLLLYLVLYQLLVVAVGLEAAAMPHQLEVLEAARLTQVLVLLGQRDKEIAED